MDLYLVFSFHVMYVLRMDKALFFNKELGDYRAMPYALFKLAHLLDFTYFFFAMF